MAKFNLKYKEDIEKFGLDKFTQECKNFSIEKAKLMTEDMKRLGIWMDNEHAYMPIENSYIEGEWFLIKKAHENNITISILFITKKFE